MAYYENSQWPTGAQGPWDHQTPPPPTRSGANSAIPRDEPTAFLQQLEEVDRAIDNLLKSGKMFNAPGRNTRPGSGPRHNNHGHDFNDPRGAHSQTNLQNFYNSQRHQSSRGSNEAEQMMQAKRRMAAQRERELRNYHQEQQYNRTVLSEVPSYGNGAKTDRTMSPGGMSEEDRRDLIARQRSALYGEGPFAESGGYIDETGTPRPGVPGALPNGAIRGRSPLAFEFGRTPPHHQDAAGHQQQQQQQQQLQQQQSPAGVEQGQQEQNSRANSNASPQSNAPTNKIPFDAQQSASRTSTSSPTGGSPPRQGAGAPGSKPGQSGSVAPIGTRPSGAAPQNPALSKPRSTTPLPSPLSQGYNASTGSGSEDNGAQNTGGLPNPTSASAEGSNVGLSGWGRGGAGVWGSKSGLGVQASVWG